MARATLPRWRVQTRQHAAQVLRTLRAGAMPQHVQPCTCGAAGCLAVQAPAFAWYSTKQGRALAYALARMGRQWCAV